MSERETEGESKGEKRENMKKTKFEEEREGESGRLGRV